MMRVHAFAVVALGFVAASTWLAGEDPPTKYEHDASTDAWMKRRSQFLTRLESLMREWEEKQVTLKEVVARIKDYGETYYPSYLRHVDSLEEGDSLDMRLAHNLLKHYEQFEGLPGKAELLARIRSEFAETFQKTESKPVRTGS